MPVSTSQTWLCEVNLGADLSTLWQMARGQSGSSSHAARLEAFYRPQAAAYDRFRERLLMGREGLIAALDIRAGQQVLELGAGTGRNAEFFAAVVPTLARLCLVDLCPALLEQARLRAARWTNCEVIEADATHYQATGMDRVFLSYALSMMPDWHTVLNNACAMLADDGLLGVVDFYVADAQPSSGLARHGALTRWLWPRWFAHDGVRLDSASLRALRTQLTMVHLYEGLAHVPYLPGLRVPYFVFVGRRP